MIQEENRIKLCFQLEVHPKIKRTYPVLHTENYSFCINPNDIGQGITIGTNPEQSKFKISLADSLISSSLIKEKHIKIGTANN